MHRRTKSWGRHVEWEFLTSLSPIARGKGGLISHNVRSCALKNEVVGKTRGMGVSHKLKSYRRRQRWANKSYKKSHLGNEWKKPFVGSSHGKGIVIEKIGIEAKQPNCAI